MKLYRSIEFSRLTFLIDNHHNEKWKDLEENADLDKTYSNWWLKDNNEQTRHQMIKNIVSGNDAFFDKSSDFNSKVGGRFNPAKSYGAIYTSSSPTLSMLEVLYHVFDSSLGLYKNLKQSSDKLTSTFNVPVPKKIKVLIVALELEVEEPKKIVNLYENKDYFEKLCRDLGFSRYIDENFNADFIFGNAYEITNIMGCHFHSHDNTVLRAPSARVNLELQGSERFNLILPEKLISQLQPQLTGNFREYICSMDMNENGGKHAISLRAIGNTETKETIYLQNKPTRKNKRIVEFSQIDDSGENKKKFSREVQLQRFVQ